MRKEPIHIGITICPIVPRFSESFIEMLNSKLEGVDMPNDVSQDQIDKMNALGLTHYAPTQPAQETVTISKKEYDSLLEDAHWRVCLENAGVDNWTWFGDAMQEFYGEEDEDD